MSEKILDFNYGLSKNQLKKTTATVADVISGKKFYDSNGVLQDGTLVDLGYEPLAKGGAMFENKLYFYIGENAGQKRWAISRGCALPQDQVANIIGLSADKMVSWANVLGIQGTNRGYDSGYNDGRSNGINSCYVNRTTGWFNGVRDDPELKGRPFTVEVNTQGTGQPRITLHFDNGRNYTL